MKSDNILQIEKDNAPISIEDRDLMYYREVRTIRSIAKFGNYTFQFNKHGACLNPERVYFFMLPNDLAWRYIEITVSYDGKAWDCGYNAPGTGCCSGVNGSHPTKEKAIIEAINSLKKIFKEGSNVFGDHSKHEENFNQWLALRNQLTLF